ncbi:MAG: 30S ribosomal protein S2 [Alphaproteobacteria bacterium CG_4_10_14_0_8_um_filter_53_9]|nr:MAG: 30S ribosomal protein S2 [Alphaproteobacteria bacterium CG_4_10_14_0_8_um_filter_53_9]
MALPAFTISEMMAAGVHFGHRTYRWNPQMRDYIFGARNGIHIFDLTKTVPLTYSALAAVEATVARGGRVLFVGTKRQAQGVCKEEAERCGMYYINHRWLGGLLTNWKTIGKSIKRLRDLNQDFNDSAAAATKFAEMQAAATPEAPVTREMVRDPLAHLTKKERLMLERERTNLDRVLGGILNMGGLPDIVVVLSVHEDRIAVQECNRLGIPVIGVVDSNASDEGVNFVIPGNDDSIRSLGMYARLCADSVISGIEMQAQSSAVKPTATVGGVTEIKSAPRKATTVTLSKAAQAVANADEAAPAEAAPAETTAPAANA